MSQNTHVPNIDYTQISMEKMHLIDVRSPEEYEEFHIPFSINIPLFTNDERKEIGKIYKRVSIEKAKERGLAIFSKKLPAFYEQWKTLAEKSPNKPFVVICFRGGMRSGIFASVMNTLGLETYQLTGGIRSVWQHVHKRLEDLGKLDWKGIVLSGNTGTGKTYWLQKLMKKGHPVIDLEALAGHRGSIFGHIGLKPKTQKQFEFDLVTLLEKYKKDKRIIVEAESKRIGRVVVPEFLMNLMKKSEIIELSDTLQNRISRIVNDYQPSEHHDQFMEAYGILRKRISPVHHKEIDEAFDKRNYHRAFTLLIENYYDLRYDHSTSNYKGKKHDVHLEHLNDDEVIQTLEKIINKLF